MVVNETINVTTGILETVSANPLVERFIELVTAPYYHQEMIWIVIPLIIALFLMQLYFGRYRKEQLGWNTAVGNSLALIFVTVDLFRRIYTASESKVIVDVVFSDFGKSLVALIIGLLSLWLLFGDFFHLLPKKLAFFVSSSLPTTLIAYMGIVLVYTDVPLDRWTLLAGIWLLIVLVIFFAIIHVLEPFHLSGEEKRKLFK